ncbi:hypothetical protein V1512DRAFT_268577 [Lipomyces arxii]|uniref:uncharacterized protein n=1 Tax=Lipomyces arxii TaxID=56418 RepID=UPI0034CFC291
MHQNSTGTASHLITINISTFVTSSRFCSRKVKQVKQEKNEMADTTASSSTSSFVSALVLNGVIFLVFVGAFLSLRPFAKRIYQPKTFLESIPEEQRTKPLAKGFFLWLPELLRTPDVYVLKQTGLDGYFFLRYLKLIIFVMCAGIIILFPILLPVNATGGAGQKGLDILAFSNVVNQKRYYAHVFLGWIYFGFILFLIYREFIYFISVRQAVLTSPAYWNRPSFRTVLFQTVPDSFLNERTLLSLFPDARNVWINRNYADLTKKINKRDKIALQLEAAEIKLLKGAVKSKIKSDKKNGEKIGESITDHVKSRPSHKLKPLIGKKVDTINYNRSQLAELNPEIREMQDDADSAKQLNSVFIEFITPEAAFDAYQLLAHHLPLHMAPRYIGIRPDDIIWSNLRLFWWERLIRVYATTAFICVLVIFWAIPVAAVGAISNITYLTDKVHFLRFILNMPHALFGLVTALLPTILLAILMAMLPIILRLCGRLSGKPSYSLVELHVQNSYFAFQVIQVFLVTTISSAAASVVTQIVTNPTSAMPLLANNLPKASNFFISYLLLQGFSIGGGLFLQLVGLILFKVMSRLLDSTPRKMFARWSNLTSLGWGTVFPVYTNLAVIAVTYSLIAPLILLFGAICFICVYIAFQYNLMYVYRPTVDLTGLAYPRALWQTLTGLYLAEVCMIGLFAVGKNWACIVLMAIMLAVTAFFQITLQNAVVPMLHALPKSVEMERAHAFGQDRSTPTGSHNTPTLAEPTYTEKSEGTDDIEAHAQYEACRMKAKYSQPIWRFLRPDIHSSYLEMKATMVPDWVTPEYSAEEERSAYFAPAVSSEAPFLWIPKDKYGWSTTEVEDTVGVIGISDENSYFDDKGKIVRDGKPPGYEDSKFF